MMGECNTILSAYALYRHLEYYCTHPSSSRVFLHSDKADVGFVYETYVNIYIKLTRAKTEI